MTTRIVGYRLRHVQTGAFIESWGGVWGQCPGVPALLVIPGEEGEPPLQICAPALDADYAGHILEAWEMEEPPAAIVPISDRQFFQQAALQGMITQTEALAAVQMGTIPVALHAIVDAVTDPAEKFAAEMILSGATSFDRHHPLTQTVGAALGWSEEQIDQFFRAAVAL